MIAAAQLPGLRMYDLRHHCITSLLEDPRVSEETVEAIAGHVSRRMMKRYSHIRSAAKRAAVCGLYSSSGEVFKGGEPRALLPENTLSSLWEEHLRQFCGLYVPRILTLHDCQSPLLRYSAEA